MRWLPDGHEELTRLVRKWGDVNTIRQYLELMDFILEAVALPNGDPRLVTNTRKPNDIHLMPVTIGMRFVLAFARRDESAFIILPRHYERGHPLCEFTGHFGTMPRDHEPPPAWGLVRHLSALRRDETLLQAWAEAARAEISRQSKSTFRRHHKPAVYEAARNPAYRDVVFDQALNDTETL
ncbi:hypothetical protein [Deinococcus sp. YIM 77859]|uniref:hypothetical protein n=1 Tax=Deinococcus sp. YIM 77859 TaxID=1540221 RepID=UPI00054E604C|nr:hypothetical protein [Deinococcus sp. YIM 77859]